MAKGLKMKGRVSVESELDGRQPATPAFSRWTRGVVAASLAAVFFGAGTGVASALPALNRVREAMPSRTAVQTESATDLGSPTDSPSLRHDGEIELNSFTIALTGTSTAAVVGDFDGDKRDDLAGTTTTITKTGTGTLTLGGSASG